MSVLSGRDMVGGYGGADILKGCSIEVDEGEIAVIVGPNGAGKSTAMKALLGLLPLKQGSVWFRDRELTDLNPQQVTSVQEWPPLTRRWMPAQHCCTS